MFENLCRYSRVLARHLDEKTQIMQRILRMDAQMRELADPCLDQLEQMYTHQGQPQVLH